MIPLANHLWQSTLFAAAVAALAWTLRSNRAQTRHALWLAASLKFLLPFSLLMQFGATIPSTPAAPVVPIPSAVAQQVELAFVPLPSTPAPEPNWLALLWFAGAAFTVIRWARAARAVRAARRAATPLAIPAPIPVLATPYLIEPGLFGLFRPALLMPAGIEHHLSPAELRAILAHELAHLRRRDNLTALLHMAVETLFWFHPLVYYIGARLHQERERACDEEVLRLGNAPETYAAGILTVCEFYQQSPLPCVPGVTGAELKQRIRDILARRAAGTLSLPRKALLAASALAALALPTLIGVAQAQNQPTFDVASIKPANPDERNSRFNIVPGGGINVVNVPVRRLLEFAYNLRETQILNAPSWTNTTAYDITARLDSPSGPSDPLSMSDAERRSLESSIRKRTQALIEDRFQFKFHRETRDMPMLALTVARNGLKLKPVPAGDKRPPNMRMGRGTLSAQRIPFKMFAESLSRFTSQTVVDSTNVEGEFDFSLKWSPDAAPDSDGPSLNTALQEQLGLRLESRRGPVDVIVVDSISKPTAN